MVVVVLTLTGMIKSVVTGNRTGSSHSLGWNAPRKKQSKPKAVHAYILV